MFVHANDGNLVELYWLPQKNEFESAKQGHVVFDKLLMIKVASPGMTSQEPHFWVEHHFHNGTTKRNEIMFGRYGDLIEEFKRTDGEMSQSGFPIDAWPEIDVAQVETLKYNRIHTVEALASLSDTAIQSIGLGAHELRKKAQAFLGRQKETATVDDARLRDLEEQNRMLQDQLHKLNAQLNAAQIDEPKRGPGRPPKAASA